MAQSVKDHEDVVYQEAFKYVKNNFLARLEHAQTLENEEHLFSISIDLGEDGNKLNPMIEKVVSLVEKYDRKPLVLRDIVMEANDLNELAFMWYVAVSRFERNSGDGGAVGMFGGLGMLGIIGKMIEQEEKRRKRKGEDDE